MTTDTQSGPPAQRSKIRLLLATSGLLLGSLAPLVTGIVGVRSYIMHGYFISKGGEVINGPAGILMSVFFIIAGLAMAVYAIMRYRRLKQCDV